MEFYSVILDLSILEQKIGIAFKNKNLLKESLTHRSYLNENPKWSVDFTSPHNERLEFLGDAVLELAVSEYLFRRYPNYQEGQLTSVRAALVNYQMLAKVAKKIELDKFVLLSRGEAKDTGKAREVILANAFEALLGAIYLDAGYSAAKKFIEQVVLIKVSEVVEKKLYKDPKSLLQEIIQEKLKVTPSYRVLEEWGPDHQKVFRVGVFFDGDSAAAQGEGASKQEAEVEAAKNALVKLEP